MIILSELILKKVTATNAQSTEISKKENELIQDYFKELSFIRSRGHLK